MATMTQLVCRFCLGSALAVAFHARADQVVMQNGDRYNGNILSVSTTNVVLQSDVLGVVNLSRSKVANVVMASSAATNSPQLIASARTNPASDMSAAVRQLGTQSNLVRQVQAQFLATANPEANAKFSQMLNDLNTGKMTLGDLRAEARSAAEQLRALEKEAGDDTSGVVSMYLSVLDGFLAETESASGGLTNRPAPRPKP